MDKFAGDKFQSRVWKEAGNAARGKVISGGFEPEGHFVITANGKISPSVNYAQQSFGVKNTWDYLTKECHAAHDPRVGKFITSEIDY